MWIRRNKNKPKAIKSIDNSYTEEEENKLLVDEYEKLDPSLLAFDLPDVSLWTHKIPREDEDKHAVNTNALVAEVNKCMFRLYILLRFMHRLSIIHNK